MLIVLLHKANSPNITNRDSLNNDDAEMRHIGNLMHLEGTNNFIQLAEFTVGVGWGGGGGGGPPKGFLEHCLTKLKADVTDCHLVQLVYYHLTLSVRPHTHTPLHMCAALNNSSLLLGRQTETPHPTKMAQILIPCRHATY
jgi:hypothetical protein